MSTTILTASLSWQVLEAKRKILGERQDAFNEASRSGLDPTQLAAQIRDFAQAEHAAYPQYVGHWDTWTLGKIRRRIETKAGLCFEPGDIVLIAPRPRWRTLIVSYSDTVYSVRTGNDVAVNYWDVERFETP